MKLLFAAAACAGLLLPLGACSGGSDKAAFDAAKAAVSARLPNAGAGADFGNLTLRRLTGIKGSKAEVVCGGVLQKGAANGADPAPFIYFAKIEPAAPDVGHAQGEVILLTPALDRQQAQQMTHFCDAKLSTSPPNPYTYFN